MEFQKSGVPEDALIEVIGHVYGLNDSPAAWHRTLDAALREVGFSRSKFDPIDRLKSKFEFRKWRIGTGEFCGALYEQDPQTYEITMSQSIFVEKLRPLRLSRTRQMDRSALLTDEETRCLRAINGGLNWLSTQSRPDLATQTSFSQQSFPHPTVNDALNANNAIRRARQHADMPLRYRAIPPEELSVLCHSDAAYANGRDGATQAGYILSFTSARMNDGVTAPWTPAFWKSYRLPRVVNSTLSAEAQAMTTATGMVEWTLLLLSEILDGPTFLRASWQTACQRLSMVATDCKSLYDHLRSQSSPTLDDRRTSLDIIIIRESLQRTHAVLRWLPTDRMIADGLTKESAEGIDLLRACVWATAYQISPEDTVLEWRAAERERRRQKAEKRKILEPSMTAPSEGAL